MNTSLEQKDVSKVPLGGKVMFWLSIIFDLLFFGLLYVYAETYEHPRGYYLFFIESSGSAGSYSFMPVFAALSAYVARYEGYRKLLSTVILVFNVVLSLASMGFFIYFSTNP